MQTIPMIPPPSSIVPLGTQHYSLTKKRDKNSGVVYRGQDRLWSLARIGNRERRSAIPLVQFLLRLTDPYLVVRTRPAARSFTAPRSLVSGLLKILNE